MARTKLEEAIEKCIIEESYDTSINEKDWKRMEKNLTKLEETFNLFIT